MATTREASTVRLPYPDDDGMSDVERGFAASQQEAPAHLADDVEILHVTCSPKLPPDLLEGIDISHVQAVAQDDGTHELVLTA